MTDRYALSLRFAALFDSEHRHDIVHDAWLYYWEKTGKDLLTMELHDESSYLYTVVKKAFYRWWYYERRSVEKVPSGWLTSKEVSPEDQAHMVMLKDLLPEQTLVRLLSEGNRKSDAATLLGQSKQVIQYKSNKIRKKLMQYLNPIAGSRVTITKKMSKKQFEAVSDEYVRTLEGNDTVDIYVKRADEDAYNEHGTVEGVMVKLTKD